MLLLSRKVGEVITIGNSVKITVISFDRGKVRLGIEAPKNIPVHRKEIYDKIIALNKISARTKLKELKKAMNSIGIYFQGSNKDPLAKSAHSINKTENDESRI